MAKSQPLRLASVIPFYPRYFYVYEFQELRGCIKVPNREAMEEIDRLLNIANDLHKAGARLKPATLADFIHYNSQAGA